MDRLDRLSSYELVREICEALAFEPDNVTGISIVLKPGKPVVVLISADVLGNIPNLVSIVRRDGNVAVVRAVEDPDREDLDTP